MRLCENTWPHGAQGAKGRARALGPMGPWAHGPWDRQQTAANVSCHHAAPRSDVGVAVATTASIISLTATAPTTTTCLPTTTTHIVDATLPWIPNLSSFTIDSI